MKRKMIYISTIITFIIISIIIGIVIHKSNMEIKAKNKAEQNLGYLIDGDNSEIELFTKEGGILSGSHCQSDIDNFKTAIEKAKKVYDKTDATQKELSQAITNLNKAEDTFTNSPQRDNTTELVDMGSNSYSKSNSKSEPTIGMTATEVENSAWGKPLKVNRTITVNDTSEQWIYSGNRYIYLDNGVVTAIQD